MSDETTPTGEAGTPAGAGTPPAPPPAPSPAAQPKYTDEDMQRIVKERLAQAERKADEAAKKAAEEAEAKKLAEQAEWEKLAGKHEARVKELEPLAARLERHETALKAHLEALRADLPAYVLELLDGRDAPDQLEWLAKHRDELTKAPAGTSGVPATPRANGQPTDAEKVAEAAKKLQATGNYRPGVF